MRGARGDGTAAERRAHAVPAEVGSVIAVQDLL